MTARPGMPGKSKVYQQVQELHHYNYVSQKVSEMAEPRISAILSLKDWHDKQDAVDELFENVEAELKTKEEILGLHPRFGHWVERALEEYLRGHQQRGEESDGDTLGGAPSNDDDMASPIFMDCFSTDDDPEAVVPSILSPLQPHPHDGPGRMVEEWEMAAHKATKRILLRQCTRSIARALEDPYVARVYLHGQKGAGKVGIRCHIKPGVYSEHNSAYRTCS